MSDLPPHLIALIAEAHHDAGAAAVLHDLGEETGVRYARAGRVMGRKRSRSGSGSRSGSWSWSRSGSWSWSGSGSEDQ